MWLPVFSLLDQVQLHSQEGHEEAPSGDVARGSKSQHQAKTHSAEEGDALTLTWFLPCSWNFHHVSMSMQSLAQKKTSVWSRCLGVCGVTCWGDRKRCGVGCYSKAKGNFGGNGDIEDSKVIMICFWIDVYVRLTGTCWRMATVLRLSLIPFCEQNLIGHWAPNFLVGLGERPQTTKLIRCLRSGFTQAFTEMHVVYNSICFHCFFPSMNSVFTSPKENNLC